LASIQRGAGGQMSGLSGIGRKQVFWSFLHPGGGVQGAIIADVEAAMKRTRSGCILFLSIKRKY